jgi:hypothetical protein
MSAAASPNRINKDLYLQGAESFFQYNINRHLVSVIGELHMSAYIDCQYTPSTTISDYMVESAKKKGCKLLLEIFPGFKEARLIIGSKNISDVYNKAKEQGVPDNKILGFDLRKTILTSNNQDALYHSPGELLNLSSKVIAEIYVYPLSNGVNIISSMRPDLNKFYDGKKWIIDKSKYDYLENSYIKDIINHCAFILNALRDWDSLDMTNKNDVTKRSNIVQSVQDLWKKVADYQIVKDVFSLSGTEDITVICGEAHASNLSKIFNNFKVFGQFKSSGTRSLSRDLSCINLKGSYIYLD